MVDTKSQISEENKQLFIKEIDMLLKHDRVLSVQLVQVRFFFLVKIWHFHKKCFIIGSF